MRRPSSTFNVTRSGRRRTHIVVFILFLARARAGHVFAADGMNSFVLSSRITDIDEKTVDSWLAELRALPLAPSPLGPLGAAKP